MYKKLFWLFVALAILWCSPLWANDDNPWSEYIFVSNDQQQKSALTSLTPSVKQASPLDSCFFTNACFNPNELKSCLYRPLGPGTILCSFQDPGKICPPSPACPTYPFQVKNVHVMLVNCDPLVPMCAVTLSVAILSATYPDPANPNCPVPGKLLCQGPTITVQVDQLCREYIIPIPDTCCVDTSYFACVGILDTDCRNLQVCTDTTCMPCWNYIQFPGQLPADACRLDPPSPGDFAIWTDGLYSCQNLCVGGEVPCDTVNNHYKVWLLNPQPFGATVQVKDQFMSDILDLRAISFLANPVQKIVPRDPPLADTFHILDPDDHLTWYQAIGTKDTVIKVEYKNQFESTTVLIDSVRWLLVPTTKEPHPPYDCLDHYKCYYIRNPQWMKRQFTLQDQFDFPDFEKIDSLLPVYFCTPCQKNLEPRFDTLTHYVAYYLAPPPKSVPPRNTIDQFGPHTLSFIGPWGLLVPTEKLLIPPQQETCCFPFPNGFCGPVPVGTCVPSGGVVVPACLGDLNGNGIDDACEPQEPEACCFPNGSCALVPVGSCVPSGGVVVPACLGDLNGNGIDDACEKPTIDTLRNHFKTWRIITPSKDTFAFVQDQFTKYDPLKLDTIDFLSNPTIKDTAHIKRPDDHLTWYRAKKGNKVISAKVEYVNQFESTTVFIDSVKYLLLPTLKLFPPHNPPDTLLGHYTAYKIRNPKTFKKPVPILIQDQFDLLFGAPELIDSLKPVYFLTPADKNNELRPKSDTHYVAYEIFPKRVFDIPTQTVDQFGGHGMQIRFSELLLVPSRKDTFTICAHKPNDCSGDGAINLTDIICDVNVVFRPGTPKPVPNCRCDSNDDGKCNLPDIIHKVNYVFRSGPEPVPSKECCKPVK